MYQALKIFGGILFLLQVHVIYAATLQMTTPAVCWNSNSMTLNTTMPQLTATYESKSGIFSYGDQIVTNWGWLKGMFKIFIFFR